MVRLLQKANPDEIEYDTDNKTVSIATTIYKRLF